MSEKKQVGLRVDASLYEEFKEDVKDRRGRWQGVAGEELENAMRDYLYSEFSAPAGPDGSDFDRRLSRVENELGIGATDGGVATPSDADPHTHAPTERPAANSPTDKKTAWLAECVRDHLSGEFEEVSKSALQDVVKEEYGFRSDTAKRYVSELVDHFGLVDHPNHDTIYVTPDRREEIIEARREEIEQEEFNA